MKVKDMTPEQRAERALRRRLARERRTFGLLPPIESVEHLSIEDGWHVFMVEFEGTEVWFFDVKVYSKSARVRESIW